MIDITKKQYVLSSCKLDFFNMQENRIGEYYLYTHSQLNVDKIKTSAGKTVFLLGNAFCTDSFGKKAQNDIELFCGEALESATSYWTGRWVIVTEDEFFTDATGLMGAFYGYKNNNWFISSSLAIISKIIEKSAEEKVKSDGISWHILPDSILPDVNTLICTQKLLIAGNTLKPAPKMWMRDYCQYSTEEKCQAVADMLTNGIKNIGKYSDKKIVLALTGGKDSRLTLAALLKAEIPFSSYTAEHKNISHSDKSVPAKLSKMFGITHHYIKIGSHNQKMRINYDNFCAINSNGADAQFYAHGQFSKFTSDTLILRSGLFEAAQTYARSYTTSDFDGFARDLTNYYSDLRTSLSQKTAFDKWLKTVEQNPSQHVDIRDRFYIEQRVGGWVAAIEQSLDINDFMSIQIANCAELLSILLSCNEEERKTLAISYGTIKLLEPKALDVPVNKKSFSDNFTRIKGIIKNPTQKLKNYLNKNRR